MALVPNAGRLRTGTRQSRRRVRPRGESRKHGTMHGPATLRKTRGQRQRRTSSCRRIQITTCEGRFTRGAKAEFWWGRRRRLSVTRGTGCLAIGTTEGGRAQHHHKLCNLTGTKCIVRIRLAPLVRARGFGMTDYWKTCSGFAVVGVQRSFAPPSMTN